jgi:hypothetical protein
MTKQEVNQMDADKQDVTPVHGNIAEALAAAQMEMGKAVKDATNPHFKSKYADLGSVMEACLPALNKHGIAVIQPMMHGEHGRDMVTKFIHQSGETLECPVPLIVGKNDMQGLGSAMTYARRYGLMALAGIAPEDDDGNAAAKAAPKTVTPDQFVKLRDKAEEAGVEEEKICGAYGAQSFQKFPADSFAKAMKRLQLTIDEKPAVENADLDGDSLPEGV